MCLLFCLRLNRWGAGPGPVAIDREVVYSDMTECRWFGRAPNFYPGSGTRLHEQWQIPRPELKPLSD